MNGNPLCKPWEHRLSRRQMLATAAGGWAAGVGLGPLLDRAVAAEVQKQRKQVIFVWIDGGMSQLETWDPKPNTRFGGPFRTIETSVPGIHVSELVPHTAKVMHHLSLVRSVCTKDNSHSAGVGRIQRGDPKNRGVTYPFFGSAVAKLLGPGDSGLPPYIWVKPGSSGFIYKDAGFLGAKYGALALGDGKPPPNLLRHPDLVDQDAADREALRIKANDRFSRGRRSESNEANSYVYDMAAALMKRQDLFDDSQNSPRDVQRYGRHELGRHMLQGRKLLEAGVTFVKVNSYGWDTHGDNFNAHANMVPRFDQPFAALIEDLEASGRLEHTLVIAMSEFGRTPRINGHVGRDHWPEAWSVVMAGCGLHPGAVVGATNDEGTFVKGDEHDIGHLFHTWFQALGIDSKFAEYDNHGQPLPIAHDDCAPIKQLLT